MAQFTSNDLTNALNASTNLPLTQVSPAVPQGDGTQLPYSTIQPNNTGIIKRSNITWFVPQFGIVRMFINPQSISYANKKLITKERTKGGYTLQYWGEELTQLTINGTTGSSGVEGINALYEVYRAEQYAFDATALSLAANNAVADVSNNLTNGIAGTLGNNIGLLVGGTPNNPSLVSGTAGILGGVLGLDSPNNMLAARNIPSLAQLAFTVEMYYDGWVYRGYFDSMTMTEKATDFLWDYNIVFMATQRRGYRVNYFPFQRSANTGASQYDTPFSFNGQLTSGNY